MSNLNPYKDIYSYIQTQESQFQNPITLPGNWNWSFLEHCKLSYLYSHSQLANGKNEWTPVNNITKPILNLQHRTEDIDLKDVNIYVDDPQYYHLSFLIKKYHDDVFVKENDLDTFFDELNVSRIDYGGGLSKATAKSREVVDLHSIAFCDQTDILSGPIGIKHFFSPSQLKEMEKKGWGDTANGATASIDEVIVLSRDSKREPQTNNQESKTPGNYIEVYEVHGDMPKRFLNEKDDSEDFVYQIQIVTYYEKENGKKEYITLFKAEEKTNPFKLIKRDPVYGRALGWGGAEELFEDQVWTNYDAIRIQDMLDAAAKTVMITQDKQLAQRHPGGLKDLDNMEFIYEAENGNTRQLDTFPRNLALFEQSMERKLQHAKEMGASQDPLTGKESPSGTPFAALQAQIQQGMGLHEYRRGQFAKHIEEIYMDDYLPKIAKEITKGTRFLTELSSDEMEFVAERMANYEANQLILKSVLNGKPLTQEEVDALKEQFKQSFMQGGNKKFVEILKDEFKDLKLKVKANVASKQKNLPQMVDKLVNIMRFAISNPAGLGQLMQVPGFARMMKAILEYSDLDQLDFSGMDKLVPPAQPEQPQLAQANG